MGCVSIACDAGRHESDEGGEGCAAWGLRAECRTACESGEDRRLERGRGACEEFEAEGRECGEQVGEARIRGASEVQESRQGSEASHEEGHEGDDCDEEEGGEEVRGLMRLTEQTGYRCNPCDFVIIPSLHLV